MTMSSYRKFIEFLDENGCRMQFEKAFYLFNRCHRLSEGLWKILGADECFIGRAFDWSDTPEGYDYWLSIDNKWYNQNITS